MGGSAGSRLASHDDLLRVNNNFGVVSDWFESHTISKCEDTLCVGDRIEFLSGTLPGTHWGIYIGEWDSIPCNVVHLIPGNERGAACSNIKSYLGVSLPASGDALVVNSISKFITFHGDKVRINNLKDKECPPLGTGCIRKEVTDQLKELHKRSLREEVHVCRDSFTYCEDFVNYCRYHIRQPGGGIKQAVNFDPSDENEETGSTSTSSGDSRINKFHRFASEKYRTAVKTLRRAHEGSVNYFRYRFWCINYRLVSDWCNDPRSLPPFTVGDRLEFSRTGPYAHWGIYVGKWGEYHDQVVHFAPANGNGSMFFTKKSCCSESSAEDKPVIRVQSISEILLKRVRINNSRDNQWRPLLRTGILDAIQYHMKRQSDGHTPVYGLCSNNCEHFVNRCRYGEHHSDQIARLTPWI
ncbi:uncharacterized protein LOC119735372 [Patiria miniata]|uniref:LRAT domain-containing protein n=1 Tax=Patiria miniata TaxID=46514 RepID=A0A914AN16_PATMI|nr:uncharacterized protein LOC119735372 [Patiria miniata]